jgi:glycosyltransferase involved in cell wall biosynthesis
VKPKIHFHSDCAFFGGSENMLAVFFNSRKIHDKFEISFSYGYSRAYEDGFNERVKTAVRKYPLKNTYPHWNAGGPGIVRYPAAAAKKLAQYIYFMKNICGIYRIIKREKPDIVHINNGGYPAAYSCSAVVFAAKLAGRDKIVYVVNNVAVPRNTIDRKIDFWIDRFVSRNTARFVTGSNYAGERLKSVLEFKDEQYTRIPNTVLARSRDESQEETRRRLGAGKNDILIGNVALYEERKGQRYLIEAFRELTGEPGAAPGLRLVLEGKGETKGELEEQVKSSGLDSRVTFVEEKNIYNLYNCLDLLVLSSITYEDFPSVILEAMSLGKPVIGTNIAGIPEQIEDGGNGYIVAPRNAGQLKDAMKKIVGDKDLRGKMGRRSQEIFNANFKEAIIIDRYINLWETLLKTRR